MAPPCPASACARCSGRWRPCWPRLSSPRSSRSDGFADRVTSVTISGEMALEVVARERELASVAAFLAEPRAAPGALLLEGEAGIGKSTLWLAAVEQARGRGLRGLSARPAGGGRTVAVAGGGGPLRGGLQG